jgi:hypothetical protein
MKLRIHSYESKGSQPKEHNIKALLRNIILLVIHKIGFRMEVFYLYHSAVGV